MLEIGDILDDRYRILNKIGRGGMGVVYEGVHTRMERRVAIKLLRASAADDPQLVQRFEREAQAAGRIGSDHIVQVYDVGELPSGEPYIVMELLEGHSLWARLKQRGRMAPSELFPLTQQLLEGLAAAHAAGIVHRDLKPANVFLIPVGGADFVKILDFGVSKFREMTSEGVTQSGAILGTPHYMAPEQTKGARHADHRSDLYAVGAIIYRCLSGRTPYRAETMHELLTQLITEDPPSIDTVIQDLDPRAAAIVNRALERDPARRYQTAGEFADALGSYLSLPMAARNDDTPTRAIVVPEPRISDEGEPSSKYLPAPLLQPAAPRASRMPFIAVTAAVLTLGGAVALVIALDASKGPTPVSVEPPAAAAGSAVLDHDEDELPAPTPPAPASVTSSARPRGISAGRTRPSPAPSPSASSERRRKQFRTDL